MQSASYACDGFAGKRPAHSSAVALETPRGLSPASLVWRGVWEEVGTVRGPLTVLCSSLPPSYYRAYDRASARAPWMDGWINVPSVVGWGTCPLPLYLSASPQLHVFPTAGVSEAVFM